MPGTWHPVPAAGRAKATWSARWTRQHYTADGRRVAGLHRAAIPILTPRRCGHGECICTECADSWMLDWLFYFDRTAGGRRLRNDLGGEAAVEALNAPRLAWESGQPPRDAGDHRPRPLG